MIKEKRAQFFLIFAVIIGILMLSIISLTNNAEMKNQNVKDLFDLKCENYRQEVFKISENAIASNNKSGEYGYVYDFTKKFVSEMNKTFDFQMIYLYGDESSGQLGNYLDYRVNATGAAPEGINPGFDGGFFGSEVTVVSQDLNHEFTRTYKFSKDTSFYFYMKVQKEKEVYVCE